MPIHPVSIVIGTTIAVLGSGYAFKKFIYDPHLAPYIESFLSSRQYHLEPGSRSSSRSRTETLRPRRPVPVPISARSSAIKDPSLGLRRRSNRRTSAETHELREHLLPKRPDLYDEESIRVSPPQRELMLDERADENLFRRRSTRLIDLDTELGDQPLSVQDAEVREVIFGVNQQSGSSTPHYPFPGGANLRQPIPSHSEQLGSQMTSENKTVPDSTTYSFLSLSQASSPEVSQAMLGSWSFTAAGAATQDGGLRSPDVPRAGLRMEDDVTSLSSGMSGYEDAETYSLGAEQRLGLSLPDLTLGGHGTRNRDVSGSASGSASGSGSGSSIGLVSGIKVGSSNSGENGNGMGLANRGDTLGLSSPVDSLGMAWVDARSTISGGMRSPMSVVSLSESEGWRSDDWEITSER